jgi:transketolase
MPELVGGSADLTGSNNTKTKAATPVRPAISPAATSITASASTAWRRR